MLYKGGHRPPIHKCQKGRTFMLRNWYIRENVKYVSILLVMSLLYTMFFPAFIQADIGIAMATEQRERETGKEAWRGSGQFPKGSKRAVKKQRSSAVLPAAAAFPCLDSPQTQPKEWSGQQRKDAQASANLSPNPHHPPVQPRSRINV